MSSVSRKLLEDTVADFVVDDDFSEDGLVDERDAKNSLPISATTDSIPGSSIIGMSTVHYSTT